VIDARDARAMARQTADSARHHKRWMNRPGETSLRREAALGVALDRLIKKAARLPRSGLPDAGLWKRGRYYLAGKPLAKIRETVPDNSRAPDPCEMLKGRSGPTQLSLPV
jgi:hypothetical protein